MMPGAFFDTVVGPNLRMSDNMIQLAVITGGGLLCALIGGVWAWRTDNPPLVGVLLGGFAGVVLSLFLSGAVLGIIRFRAAVKRAEPPAGRLGSAFRSHRVQARLTAGQPSPPRAAAPRHAGCSRPGPLVGSGQVGSAGGRSLLHGPARTGGSRDWAA